ncbi:MAG: putative toxin-antitoxin system toxin component, PIN family [Candidatus Diapherotrites archaeon]|uniref:Putative toxin-antitoxin system toxin component, PIN family n=1 Tax=Candidatus Iainarchaeum sp. TaxID=3101447 RepID=A0A8T4L355_9ARCH|nr:putative toxin-antitoxin system toxin component, PIN family [Candidatus Diapherotrites archaeon]
MAVVLDTNVLISATFWPGASNHITLLAIEQKIRCFTSPEIMDEYSFILDRDFKQTKSEIEAKVSKVLSFHEVVNPGRRLEIVKDDPADNKIIEAALEAHADFIVTGDKHLLKIGEYNRIRIVTPKNFLDEITNLL